MAEVKNLSVLISHASVDTFSRLVSVLQSSGFNIIASHVDSRESLSEELRDSRIDLILAQQEYKTPSPAQTIYEVKGLNRDIPVLIMTDELTGADVAAGIRIGARDVIAIGEDQHLAAVVSRELKDREERSRHRDTLRRFHASESRYQQLLQHVQLPMAIVHESMLVLVNDDFAELFDIDKDEADVLPIADILDKDARRSYRKIVKQFTGSPDKFPGAELNISLTSKEGGKTEVQIDVASIQFNGEECLQLKIEPQLEQASAGATVAPRNKLVQHIASCIGVAHSEKKDSCLLCIEIDAFEQLQDALGIGSAAELYSVFTDFICETFEGRMISVFDHNRTMVLLEQTQGSDALESAQSLCKTIDSKVFECGDNSQQMTATVGIALISDLSTNADTAIKQSIRACAQHLESKGEKGAGNGAHLYEPEKTDNDTDVDINFLLKQAFKHKHLQILFQPMMKFRGEAGKNYEVLLGIRPEHKETYPDDFIGLAATANGHDGIDRWVIAETMKRLLKKLDCGGDEQLYLHVSKQSLANAKFAAWIGTAIKKSRLKPRQMTFQLREADVSTSLNAATAFVKSIKSLGCSSVITHFGRSAQSMKILDRVPFAWAKIDASLSLAAQKGDPEGMTKILEQIAAKEVQAIVPMVERAAIMPTLWKSNVAYIQGGYIQAPGDKMDYKF